MRYVIGFKDVPEVREMINEMIGKRMCCGRLDKAIRYKKANGDTFWAIRFKGSFLKYFVAKNRLGGNSNVMRV